MKIDMDESGVKCETQYWKHLKDKNCEFYPCHKDISEHIFNCRFCYCPAFLIPNCPGIESGYATILQNGWKTCEHCTINHDVNKFQIIIDAVSKEIG